MAIQGLLEVEHEQVINQLKALIAKHTHPSFSPHRKQLEEEGLPVNFYDELYQLTEAYRESLTGRNQSEATFEAETDDARDWAQEGRNWLDYVHSRVRVALAERAPNADNAARLLWHGKVDKGTASSVADSIHQVLRGFADPVVSVVRVYEGCVDKGRSIWQAIQAEQAGYNGAVIDRQIGTSRVHEINDKIGQRLEVLVAIRDAVEIRFGITLPGFEFELLRAAAARNKKREEDDGTTENAPPKDEGNTGFT